MQQFEADRDLPQGALRHRVGGGIPAAPENAVPQQEQQRAQALARTPGELGQFLVQRGEHGIPEAIRPLKPSRHSARARSICPRANPVMSSRGGGPRGTGRAGKERSSVPVLGGGTGDQGTSHMRHTGNCLFWMPRDRSGSTLWLLLVIGETPTCHSQKFLGGAPASPVRRSSVGWSRARTRQLEAMAARSQAATIKHFGRVMRLFAPLYLSNECINNCKYCGFSRDNPILRVTLPVAAGRRGGTPPGQGRIPQRAPRGGRTPQICFQRLPRSLHPGRAGAGGRARRLARSRPDGNRGIPSAGRGGSRGA